MQPCEPRIHNLLLKENLAIAAIGTGAEHGWLGWLMMRDVGKYDSHVEGESRMNIQAQVHVRHKIANKIFRQTSLRICSVH